MLYESLSRSSTTYRNDILKKVVAFRRHAESLPCFVSTIMDAMRSDVNHIFARLGGFVGGDLLACQLRPRPTSISYLPARLALDHCLSGARSLLVCPTDDSIGVKDSHFLSFVVSSYRDPTC